MSNTPTARISRVAGTGVCVFGLVAGVFGFGIDVGGKCGSVHRMLSGR